MNQAEVVRSLLIEVGDLISEATNVGDKAEVKRLMRRREALVAHLNALSDTDSPIAA